MILRSKGLHWTPFKVRKEKKIKNVISFEVFVKENTLERAFAKVCGAKPADFISKQSNDVYDEAKRKNTPIVSVRMALDIAHAYVQFLKNS